MRRPAWASLQSGLNGARNRVEIPFVVSAEENQLILTESLGKCLIKERLLPVLSLRCNPMYTLRMDPHISVFLRRDGDQDAGTPRAAPEVLTPTRNPARSTGTRRSTKTLRPPVFSPRTPLIGLLPSQLHGLNRVNPSIIDKLEKQNLWIITWISASPNVPLSLRCLGCEDVHVIVNQ